jgi:hypothetical protein
MITHNMGKPVSQKMEKGMSVGYEGEFSNLKDQHALE